MGQCMIIISSSDVKKFPENWHHSTNVVDFFHNRVHVLVVPYICKTWEIWKDTQCKHWCWTMQSVRCVRYITTTTIDRINEWLVIILDWGALMPLMHPCFFKAASLQWSTTLPFSRRFFSQYWLKKVVNVLHQRCL